MAPGEPGKGIEGGRGEESRSEWSRGGRANWASRRFASCPGRGIRIAGGPVTVPVDELETILDHTPFMICHVDRDLRYVRASKAYAAVVGRTPDEIVGKRLADIMGAEGFEAVRPHVEAALQGQRV